MDSTGSHAGPSAVRALVVHDDHAMVSATRRRPLRPVHRRVDRSRRPAFARVGPSRNFGASPGSSDRRGDRNRLRCHTLDVRRRFRATEARRRGERRKDRPKCDEPTASTARRHGPREVQAGVPLRAACAAGCDRAHPSCAAPLLPLCPAAGPPSGDRRRAKLHRVVWGHLPTAPVCRCESLCRRS